MESRKDHLQRLGAQIAHDGYDIDADAVAEAIVRRLLANRGLAAIEAQDDEP
jgi:hypothetical protein